MNTTQATPKPRVLCVDDEPNLLRSLRWLLQKRFAVDVAASGLEALALVRNIDYDVVISDQRMPGMIGSELLREVRKISPRSMRLLLTGYSDMASIVTSINEGEVFRFINKPWAPHELLGVVGEAASIAAQSPTPTAGTDDDTADVASGGDSILVIEDDDQTCDAIRTTIGSAAPVVVAHDLADAVDAFSTQTVGIVVSNMRVGQIDATRMIKLLKHEHPDVVTLVYTDVDDAVDVIALINQAQVFRVLPKPVKPTMLRLALTAATLKRRQLKDRPGAGLRHAVQAPAADARESLLRDVEQVARSKATLRGEGASFLQRLGGSLRRMFGVMPARAPAES